MSLSDSALSRLSNQHLTIHELVSGIAESRMRLHPAPGKWSIHDNIAHLARYNIVFQQRLDVMQQKDAPVFERYNADADPEFPAWQQKSLADLLSSVKAEREKLHARAKSFSEKDFERTGIHPRFGTLSITGWLEFFLLHEAHHTFTIFQLKNDVSLSA